MADKLADQVRNIKPGEKVVYYEGQSGHWQSGVSSEARDAIVAAREMNLAHFLQQSLGGGRYIYFMIGR